VGALLCGAGRLASAYPLGSQFDASAIDSDGGGGVLFTGAPRFAGHACEVCHVGAPGRISAGVETPTDEAELLAHGFRPGTTYHLRVHLFGEWAGIAFRGQKDAPAAGECGQPTARYHPCNNNGFALEIDDGRGRPVGTFAPIVAGGGCAPSPPDDADWDVRVAQDGTGVTHRGGRPDRSHWDLCWTAPPAGAGPLVAYLAVVDGSGGDGTMQNPSDNINDDVARAVVPLAELGSPAQPPLGAACAMSPPAGPVDWPPSCLFAALLWASAWVLGRRRFTRRQ
jgi:hypothetical protein